MALRPLLTAFPELGIELIQRVEAWEGGKKPFADITHLVLDLSLLPSGSDGAGGGPNQVMVHERHEAQIIAAFPAFEEAVIHHVHNGLGVVCRCPAQAPPPEPEKPPDALQRPSPGSPWGRPGQRTCGCRSGGNGPP